MAGVCRRLQGTVEPGKIALSGFRIVPPRQSSPMCRNTLNGAAMTLQVMIVDVDDALADIEGDGHRVTFYWNFAGAAS